MVVSVGFPPRLDNILVAAHSNDADNRPLDSYEKVVEMRYLHILGAVAPTPENGGEPLESQLTPQEEELQSSPEADTPTPEEEVAV